MSYTRVKICGVTQVEDAVRAAELGADAVGLNLYRGPRKITIPQATAIVGRLPMFVTPVVLTEFAQLDDIGRQDDQMVLFDSNCYYQMYGQIPSDAGETYDNHWAVVPVESQQTIQLLQGIVERLHWKPCAIVLDTASAAQAGGTGKAFDWKWIAEAREAGDLEGLPPIILAGGLTPENVAEAVRIARPYAVDVSSGVEAAGRPGVKDAVKVRDFIQAAKRA